MAEFFSREKLRQTPQKEGGEILCDPGWCVHKSDVQNKWDDNTCTLNYPSFKKLFRLKTYSLSIYNRTYTSVGILFFIVSLPAPLECIAWDVGFWNNF